MKIFISYRHGDGNAGTANFLQARLADHFDASEVFLDSGYLDPGDPFPKKLETNLATCRVFLALIDETWIEAQPRLQQPNDWVRREIETALRRRANDGIRIIPVLVGVEMPAADSLPPSLTPLAGLLAARLRGESIEEDIAALAQQLRGLRVPQLVLWLTAARQAALLATMGLLLLFSASVVALFDVLNIDTGLEAFTMALADLVDDAEPSDALAIVAIDPATERRLNKKFDKSWRREHATLIRRLSEAGAKVIAFDIYLASPSDDDAALAAAAAEARQRGTSVVFGSADRSAASVLPASAVEHGLLCVGTELDWARLAVLVVLRPLPSDAASAAGVGAGLGAGAAKWQYLPSLGARAVAPGATISLVDIENRQVIAQPPGGEPLRLRFSRTEPVRQQQTCAALATGDIVAQGIVRFTRIDLLRDPARRHRYEDILDADAATLAARYRGKIVLVGSELDAEDNRSVYRGLRPEQRYGYEIQADVINTLLQGITIRAVSPLPQFLLMLGMGVLGLAGHFWDRLATPLRRRVYGGAVAAVYLALSILLCAQAHLLLNGAYHLAAFFFAYWVAGRIVRRMGLLNRARASA